MDTNEFRTLGHDLIEWIAAYREHVGDYPVMSRVQPGEVAAQLPAEPPLRGGGLEAIIADLDRVVMPGITHWNHPGFLHYFPSNSDLSSVLADLVSSGLGVQGMSWQTSPAATEVEDVVMEWLRGMVGLPDTFTGVIEDTASTSTFTALLCARERTSGSPRTAAACRPRTRRSSCTRATRRTARSPRRRCSPASAPSTCAYRDGRRARAPAGPAGARRRGRPRGRPAALRRGGRRRDDRDHGARPGGRHRRPVRAPRPLAARRRGARRHGDDLPRVPLDVGGRRTAPTPSSSTRTSGWAPASTSPPTTSATPSTWCA